MENKEELHRSFANADKPQESKDLQNYIEKSKNRLNDLLKCLQWTEESVLKNFNSNSQAAADPLNYKKHDIEPSLPLSCVTKNSIIIGEQQLRQLVDNPVATIPQKFSQLQLNFSREQKLRLYEYVVEHTEKYMEPELTVPIQSDGNSMTFAEIVAIKKREKKKKEIMRKYRTSKPTQIEEVRNLVALQMQALEQYIKPKTCRHESRSRQYDHSDGRKRSRSRQKIPFRKRSRSRSHSRKRSYSRKRSHSQYRKYLRARSKSKEKNSYEKKRSTSRNRKHHTNERSHSRNRFRNRSLSRDKNNHAGVEAYHSRKRSKSKQDSYKEKDSNTYAKHKHHRERFERSRFRYRSRSNAKDRDLQKIPRDVGRSSYAAYKGKEARIHKRQSRSRDRSRSRHRTYSSKNHQSSSRDRAYEKKRSRSRSRNGKHAHGSDVRSRHRKSTSRDKSTSRKTNGKTLHSSIHKRSGREYSSESSCDSRSSSSESSKERKRRRKCHKSNENQICQNQTTQPINIKTESLSPSHIKREIEYFNYKSNELVENMDFHCNITSITKEESTNYKHNGNGIKAEPTSN